MKEKAFKLKKRIANKKVVKLKENDSLESIAKKYFPKERVFETIIKLNEINKVYPQSIFFLDKLSDYPLCKSGYTCLIIPE